jgi:hypothetical protein
VRYRLQAPRALFAWIVGLALVAGNLSPHAGPVEHASASLKGTFVAEAAGHPHQPAHMEPSQLRFHPGCAACVLGLQTVGVAPPLPAHLPVPTLQSASLVSLLSEPPAPVRPCGSPRAPPVSRASV